MCKLWVVLSWRAGARRSLLMFFTHHPAFSFLRINKEGQYTYISLKINQSIFSLLKIVTLMREGNMIIWKREAEVLTSRFFHFLFR